MTIICANKRSWLPNLYAKIHAFIWNCVYFISSVFFFTYWRIHPFSGFFFCMLRCSHWTNQFSHKYTYRFYCNSTQRFVDTYTNLIFFVGWNRVFHSQRNIHQHVYSMYSCIHKHWMHMCRKQQFIFLLNNHR